MSVRRLVVSVCVAIALLVAMRWTPKPSAAPASAPPTEFSAERALSHLTVIAGKPHPTGSPADADVRAYLTSTLERLGLAVEVQDATGVSGDSVRYGGPAVGARVRNVIARRKGTVGGPSLVLMAHYDSRELAPGASDDGYGTAALLETARALVASPPLRHDVVFLFTEGEEQGLFGAKAFVQERPEAADVALVLNFDAGGTRGDVYMFETGPGASDLIDVFARSAPYPEANSLTRDVYRMSPHDTDLTAWLQASHAGMNFANADGVESYHQPTDAIDYVDLATLQHHGSYALSLARAFADREVIAPKATSDAVYFNMGGLFFHYPAGVALPAALVAVVLLVFGLVVGVRRARLTITGLALGALASAALPAVAAGAAWGAWSAVRPVHDEALSLATVNPASRSACIGAWVVLGAAVTWAGYAALSRRLRAVDLAAGGMSVWGVLAVFSAVALPGGSYLFLLPLLAAAVALALQVFTRVGPYDRAALIAHVATAVLAILLFLPWAFLLGVGFGPEAAPAIAGFSAWMVTGSVGAIDAVAGDRRLAGPLTLLAGAVGLLGYAVLVPPFNARSPQPDSLLAAVDADRHEVWWVSADDAPADRTGTSLARSESTEMPEFFFGAWAPELFHTPAPAVDVEAARLADVTSEPNGAGRAVSLRIVPPPRTELLAVYVPSAAHLSTALVRGHAVPLEADGSLYLLFYGPPPTGLDMSLVVAERAGSGVESAPASMRVVAQVRGFPAPLAATLRPRPIDRMPRGRALLASDMTLVSSGFTLGP